MQATESDEMRDVVVRATRAFVGIAAQALFAVADDVSLPQYRVLVLLEEGPRAMGDLAGSLGVTASTATRACDRLADKGLISRHADQTDRRSVRVQLTKRGRRLVDEVTRRRRRTIDAILDRMGTAAERRLAIALAEFSDAAGQAHDHAWTLGWSSRRDDDGSADATRTKSERSR
jgi:DNA-binding MarR family transcriptional regulator